jgi:hypothetical protein
LGEHQFWRKRPAQHYFSLRPTFSQNWVFARKEKMVFLTLLISVKAEISVQ